MINTRGQNPNRKKKDQSTKIIKMNILDIKMDKFLLFYK